MMSTQSTDPSTPTQLEENKRIALSWFDSMHRADSQGASRLMTDDFEHVVPGELPVSGRHSGPALQEYYAKISTIMGLLTGPVQFTFGAITAEGDRVCVEAESYVGLVAGGTYHGQYHFLFRIRDGKIAQVKEYLDTQHIARVVASPHLQGPPSERFTAIDEADRVSP
ncbi:MAG: hypothetical protein JWN99_1722 [Ilumatobacteraceae bacterium]|nr:hypothetical protein [Ilumatobacteraceae bacterium]